LKLFTTISGTDFVISSIKRLAYHPEPNHNIYNNISYK